jgi:hypothetical protein
LHACVFTWFCTHVAFHSVCCIFRACSSCLRISLRALRVLRFLPADVPCRCGCRLPAFVAVRIMRYSRTTAHFAIAVRLPDCQRFAVTQR